MNRFRSMLCLLPLLAAAGCSTRLPQLPPSQVPVPAASEIESIIYLVGDAGYLDARYHPLYHVLRNDVEQWSGRLARDGAVVLVYLGDNIYPLGLHPAGTPEFPADSMHLEAQVDMVAGPNARRYGTTAYFLAGNHDWGNARNERGIDRLRNQEQFLNRRRERGINVRLQPEAGEPGPAVRDVGTHTRLLLYDTAWWLLAESDYLKQRSFQQTEDMIRTTRTRNVIVAAHHPMRSASSHGGLFPFWKAMGLRFILARSGAMLQDLNSLAYRELLDAMTEAFRHNPPMLFVGGHDHNLQLIAETDPTLPKWHVVSGSASKTSDVGHIEGMLYRSDAPGYMKVVTHRDGQVDLFITAASDDADQACSGSGDALARCMAEKAALFTERYSLRLK